MGITPPSFWRMRVPSLAGQLERVLFEEGFEVMAVEENSFFSSAKNAWAALQAAGFVVIYHKSIAQR